jgi:hypothetical protein
MGAPKGNQFWKARSKHGRDKIFKTPELMLDAACDYFQWVEDNPLNKSIVYQGAVSEGAEELMRAMTIKGLCIYWGVNSIYLSDFVGKLDLESEEGKDFNVVISTIKEIIETQKFEGASAGLLNPNIIARDLGLADKKELTGDIENPLTMVIKEISGNTLGPSNSD